MAREFLPEQIKFSTKELPIDEWLETTQMNLFDIGTAIATPFDSNQARLERSQFNEEHVANLESWIDQMDEQLPHLRNFILPVLHLNFPFSVERY